MGVRRARNSNKIENVEKLSVPPGFASLTSFRLKKVKSSERTSCFTASTNASKGDPSEMNSASNVVDIAILKRSYLRRPWILDDQNNHDQEETGCRQVDTDLPQRTRLPKGVIRGCSECSNCLKVKAKWHPEVAKDVVLDDAPSLYPTEEEFRDTMKYIGSIYQKAEGCGIAEACGVCRIVPPPSWNPPCLIKKKSVWETSQFVAQIQQIDGLHNQHGQSEMARIFGNEKLKKGCILRMDSEHGVGNGHTSNSTEIECHNGYRSESEPGLRFTLESFKKYADDFKGQYFRTRSKVGDSDSNSNREKQTKHSEPSLKSIEDEYRRILENPTEEIEVLYGENLDGGVSCSGFPIASNSSEMSDHQEYLNSGWNLNNTPRLPSSLLSFESVEISNVLRPRLRIGMCFSSSYWKVEDHHLHSLCYLHLGAPKIWYGVPWRYKAKFEAALKTDIQDSLLLQPKLHNRLDKNPSLSTFKSAGIPVYRCVQYPGEFVLVLPGAYYSWFDCGFNCAEAVNIGPIDWLPHGQNVVELYPEQRRKTSISQDKLLLAAAREAVRELWETSLLRKSIDDLRWKDATGKNGILTKALRSRVKLEENRRYLCSSLQSQRMDKNFDATTKRECGICFYDLHLSAVQCLCSADRYSCLNHAKQLCSCAWNEKVFLFRYEVSELNTLVEALEGKLTAIYRWAREDLKLSLHSSVSRESSQVTKHVGGPESYTAPQHAAITYGIERSSVSNIREEMKARLHKAGSSREQRPQEKVIAPTPDTSEAAYDASSLGWISELLSGSTSASSSSDSDT